VYVDNISNVSVAVNGKLLNGSPNLFHPYVDGSTISNTIPAVVSTNATLNEFGFIDSDIPVDFGFTNYFWIWNGNGRSTVGFNISYPNPEYMELLDPDRWSLTEAGVPSAVPLPVALPLMLSGLGILGFAARRKKNTVV
jgi:hypothetical protein